MIDCVHFGAKTGERVKCLTCSGVMLDKFKCGKYGECTPKKPAAGVQCCEGCTGKETKVSNWAYGVTTCKARIDTLLPKTLVSLHNGGFTAPIVFADGCGDPVALSDRLHLNVVARGKVPLSTVGNWVMGLWELLIRNPTADKFAMFQDDLIMSAGVKEYLDKCKWPEKGYLNLYTFPLNQAVAPSAANGKAGTWFEAKECANGPLYYGRLGQKGLGAVALCFTRDAVIDLLSSRHVVERPIDAVYPTKKLDGCIVTAMNKAGWREWCHDPSLVQHVGAESSIGNRPHPLATSFKGEEWNANV